MKPVTTVNVKLRTSAIALAAIAIALLLSGSLAPAQDIGNAPTASLYGAIDINGLYMFRDPPCTTANCASPNLVVALTAQPLADPSFGLTYHFQPNAIYRINFSTTPDAIVTGQATASIDVVFSPFGNDPAACPAPNRQCQTYTVTFLDGTVFEGLTTQGSAGGVPNPAVVTQE